MNHHVYNHKSHIKICHMIITTNYWIDQKLVFTYFYLRTLLFTILFIRKKIRILFRSIIDLAKWKWP